MSEQPHDPVNHPRHYNSHPSGVECIQITEHMTFNIGNAMKYLWRAGQKEVFAGTHTTGRMQLEGHIQDLKKAAWYVNREIEKLEKELEKMPVTVMVGGGGGGLHR